MNVLPGGRGPGGQHAAAVSPRLTAGRLESLFARLTYSWGQARAPLPAPALETEDAARRCEPAQGSRRGRPGTSLPPLGHPGDLSGPGPGSGELKTAKQAVRARPPFLSASRL